MRNGRIKNNDTDTEPQVNYHLQPYKPNDVQW